MSEENKTQFRAEGDPAFSAENNENDNSSDSSTEKTEAEQTQSQEGESNSGEKKDDGEKKENLSDHPRWKEREQDWTKRFNDQEQRHTEEISKIRQDIEEKFAKKREENSNSEIPSWFGGDEASWGQYVNHENARLKEVEERTIQRLEAKAEKEQKAIDDATKYFNDTVVEIEGDKVLNPSGAKVDRNKLMKIVLDNKLVDTEGKWNYRAGFLIMTRQGPANTGALDEKKKLAGATGSDKGGESKAPPYVTSADFQKPGAKPW